MTDDKKLLKDIQKKKKIGNCLMRQAERIYVFLEEDLCVSDSNIQQRSAQS